MPKPRTIHVPTSQTRVVALRSGRDDRVVAHGKSLKAVMAKAAKAGAKEPVIVFVPKPGRRCIY